jgi:hypothetical protein
MDRPRILGCRSPNSTWSPWSRMTVLVSMQTSDTAIELYWKDGMLRSRHGTGPTPHQPHWRMLMARDATMRIVAREIALWSIISIFARDVSGRASVALNAVAVEYPRNK